MKKLIKSRKAKLSDRGIYLQDKELCDSVFKSGTKYRYVIDNKAKRIVILPSEENTGNTVSKRVISEGIKPVLDIRSKQALECMQGSDYIQVTIYEDQILLEGYSKEESFSASSAPSLDICDKFLKNPKVVDIKELLKVKRTAIISMSRSALKDAVGFTMAGQLSIDEWVTRNVSNASDAQIIDLKSKLENLLLALQLNSVCTGVGVFDLGFKNEGFEIAFAIDKEEDCCLTYRENIGDIICGDIMEDWDLPQSSVTIGGTPCQLYSSSNRKNNYCYSETPVEDPLIRRFIEMVKKNKSNRVFVYENVPEALTANNGNCLRMFKELLKDYTITHGVVSSASMGACQLRERAIVIGSKIGQIDLPKPLLSPDQYVTVDMAFQGLNDSIPNQLDFTKSKADTIERMKYVGPGGNITSIPEEIRPKSVHSCAYRRPVRSMHSFTIPNCRKAVILHPEENRILSIREIARTLGIPDSFVFKGSLTGMYQGIGNAIALSLARELARTVKNAINKYNEKISKSIDFGNGYLASAL